MAESAAVWELLQKTRLIALLNPSNPEQCLRAYETLRPLDIVLEVALRGEAALSSIELLLERHPDALILAGTVLTRNQAKAVLELGVSGVVSADYVPAVVEECVARDVMCVPGGLADAGKQLVQKSELYGISLEQLRKTKPYQWVYKVFPAMANPESTLATGSAWRAIYPDLQLVYTGGIALENVGSMARRDPNGIFCGSALAKNAGDPDKMREEAERWLAAVIGERGAVPPVRPSARPPEAGAGSGSGSDALPSVVTFGEIMLRLSPPPGQRFRQSASFDVTYGGAESNVATALAVWGVDSRFVTKLPDNDIGQSAVDLLRSFGVDTSFVLRDGDRIGIYFLEHGASQRPSRVVYDRAHSAIASVQPGEIDWNAVFAGVHWFHWTGITPALSASAAAVTLDAVRSAKQAGLKVSVDLNYRSKLWSRERAREVMTPLMEFVDVIVANEEDAANVFGIAARGSRPESGEIETDSYEDVARQLVERFDLDLAAITLRESHSASDNTWSACLFDGKEFCKSRSYPIHVVDRVGGGDAFAAGLIYGVLTGMETRLALEFAVAASCLKQTMVGDFNITSVDEVEAIAGGNVAGRIKR